MSRVRMLPLALLAAMSGWPGSGSARAQDIHDILVQQKAGQLVTGHLAGSQWSLGRRVFASEFGSNFAINNPGFNALGAGSSQMPAGSQALPGNTALGWDFLPMTIEERTANLFYWNGLSPDGMPGTTPDDVVFGELPAPGYRLSLFDRFNVKFTVTGSDEIVPGGVIRFTESDGSLHEHRFFLLEDGDGDSSTSPADGIYLIAMRLRMVGLEDSLPLFAVFGTPGSTVAALDEAAVPWVQQNVDLLVPLGIPGDFNRDGVVDAADYVVWRKPGGTYDDYATWRSHFGTSSGGAAVSGLAITGTTVPEPATASIALVAACGLALSRKRRCRQRSGPRWERSQS